MANLITTLESMFLSETNSIKEVFCRLLIKKSKEEFIETIIWTSFNTKNCSISLLITYLSQIYFFLNF